MLNEANIELHLFLYHCILLNYLIYDVCIYSDKMPNEANMMFNDFVKFDFDLYDSINLCKLGLNLVTMV